jgi:hypothetical protein
MPGVDGGEGAGLGAGWLLSAAGCWGLSSAHAGRELTPNTAQTNPARKLIPRVFCLSLSKAAVALLFTPVHNRNGFPVIARVTCNPTIDQNIPPSIGLNLSMARPRVLWLADSAQTAPWSLLQSLCQRNIALLTMTYIAVGVGLPISRIFLASERCVAPEQGT